MALFNYKFFFYGFLIGVLILCCIRKETKIFVRYPTPYNAGQIIYKDVLNNCYSLKARQTKCSNKNVLITPIN